MTTEFVGNLNGAIRCGNLKCRAPLFRNYVTLRQSPEIETILAERYALVPGERVRLCTGCFDMKIEEWPQAIRAVSKALTDEQFYRGKGFDWRTRGA
jgi:hypothetical protein